MNAVVVIRNLLVNHAPLIALVPSAKIIVGVVPQATILPAIGITEISRAELQTVSHGQATVLVTARVQVTALAKDYPTCKALLLAAKLGPGAHTGVIAGVTVRSVTRESVGPDFSDPELPLYEQSRDFIVKYIETN